MAKKERKLVYVKNRSGQVQPVWSDHKILRDPDVEQVAAPKAGKAAKASTGKGDDGSNDDEKSNA